MENVKKVREACEVCKNEDLCCKECPYFLQNCSKMFAEDVESILDKYKWHDMRGMEKEYPEQGKKIIYCFLEKNKPERKLYGVEEYVTMHNPKYDEFCDEYDSPYRSIAWRYFDGFEEEQ